MEAIEYTAALTCCLNRVLRFRTQAVQALSTRVSGGSLIVETFDPVMMPVLDRVVDPAFNTAVPTASTGQTFDPMMMSVLDQVVDPACAFNSATDMPVDPMLSLMPVPEPTGFQGLSFADFLASEL